MSNAKYSLLFKNSTEAQSKDLVDNYRCVCLEDGIKPFSNYKTKEMVSQTWPGENGEDTYFPSSLSFEAFDWEVKMATKSDLQHSVKSNFADLVNYLKASSPFKIYSSFLGDGRQGCYLTEVTDIEFSKDVDNNDIMEFTMKFRITDPLTSITLS